MSQYRIAGTQHGFAHMVLLLGVVIVAVIGGSGYVVYSRSNKDASQKTPETTSTDKSPLVVNIEAVDVPATASEAVKSTPAAKNSAGSSQKQTATPAADDALPAAPALSRNCIYSNSADAHAISAGKNTMQLLADNSYTSTAKFRDAVQFAGLSGEVNADQTVVFAVNDYVWDNKLTEAQRNYLNADPANMRSMLNWHIVHSCVTWSDGVETLTSGYAITTLGGMAYLDTAGHGKIENAEMAIWDFFSDNGAMHLLTDFVKPPAVN